MLSPVPPCFLSFCWTLFLLRRPSTPSSYLRKRTEGEAFPPLPYSISNAAVVPAVVVAAFAAVVSDSRVIVVFLCWCYCSLCSCCWCPLALLLSLLLLGPPLLLLCGLWDILWTRRGWSLCPTTLLTTSLQSLRPFGILLDLPVLTVSLGVPGCGCDTGFFPRNVLDRCPALGSPALYNHLQDKNPGDNARLAHYREDVFDKPKFRKIVTQSVLRNVGWHPVNSHPRLSGAHVFLHRWSTGKQSELLRHQKRR